MSSRWRRVSEPSGGRIARRRRVELVGFGEGRLGNDIAPCSLKPLHRIACPGAEGAVPGLDQRMADGAQDVRLAMRPIRAGIADGDRIAAAVQPIACRQGLDAGAAGSAGP
jgi:hypothetical protein